MFQAARDQGDDEQVQEDMNIEKAYPEKDEEHIISNEAEEEEEENDLS